FPPIHHSAGGHPFRQCLTTFSADLPAHAAHLAQPTGLRCTQNTQFSAHPSVIAAPSSTVMHLAMNSRNSLDGCVLLSGSATVASAETLEHIGLSPNAG